MIISHKYKFIFIKTYKTAGTSIEVFLSQYCSDKDIVTPIYPHIDPHMARNYRGLWNPLPEILSAKGTGMSDLLLQLVRRNKFYNHIPASLVKQRVSAHVWNNYYKFSLERNPWDKTLSHYHMVKDRTGGELSLEDYFQQGNFCLNYPIYTDDAGDVMVDRVIKYENISVELTEVFGKLGVPFDGDLGVRAKSEHRKDRSPYRDVYTDQQREIVERAFAKEIQLHGYTF